MKTNNASTPPTVLLIFHAAVIRRTQDLAWTFCTAEIERDAIGNSQQEYRGVALSVGAHAPSLHAVLNARPEAALQTGFGQILKALQASPRSHQR